MTVVIRKMELSNADLEAYVRLNNRVATDDVSTVEEELHWFTTADAKAHWQHWVAMRGERMVGNAFNAKDLYRDRPGCYKMHINVDPDDRRQGIGTQLYNHCMTQLSRNFDDVSFLYSSTREHYRDGVRFLEKRGFDLKMREPLSQLLVAEFDPTPFWPKAANAKSFGYAIKSLAELQKEFPDWAQRYYRLDNESMVDVPSTDPFVPPPFEQFEKSHLKDPDFQPDTIWIAIKDRIWLGLTSLWVGKGEPEKGHTGLTGVLRPARRQGVATALKLKALAHAKEQKLKVVQTDNEENNPMFQINLSMGFKAIPAYLIYGKDCNPES